MSNAIEDVMTDEAKRHHLPTDTDNGLLLIFSGPSGVGKTTITRAVERAIPTSVFSVSCTTRPMTEADVEGVDYRFVTDEQFDEMNAKGEFLETADVFGNQYGTPRDWVEEQLRRGRVVILEIDVDGAIQVKRAMPEAFGVFILPPSEEVLLGRLRDRKREPEDVIQRRFGEAQREIAAARAGDAGRDVYDAFVVNDDLERAIGEALALVEARRASR